MQSRNKVEEEKEDVWTTSTINHDVEHKIFPCQNCGSPGSLSYLKGLGCPGPSL